MAIRKRTTTDKKISIIVAVDITRPWCYIGYKGLMNAIDQVKKQHAGARIDIEYRPFILDPKLSSKEPIDKLGYLTRKFGEGRMEMVRSVISSRGEEVGIHYKWSGKLRQITSGHRLLFASYQKDLKIQTQLMGKLFKAYHEEKDNGDPEMLAEMANELGITTKDETTEFLRSDKMLKEVRDYMSDTHKNGTVGVPVMIINNEYAISGVQTSDTYLNVGTRRSLGSS